MRAPYEGRLTNLRYEKTMATFNLRRFSKPGMLRRIDPDVGFHIKQLRISGYYQDVLD